MRTRKGSREPRIGGPETARALAAELDRIDRRRPTMGEAGWFPDHAAERDDAFARTTPAERVMDAIELSELATNLAAAAARA